MKKRARKKLNDKVILFPDLEKRLLEKGLESLQQKNFRDAIDYLEEALALDPDNHDILFGLVLANLELGLLLKAKEFANRMLQMGIGDYIHIIELYIMILVQLHQYDEIVATIEILLEEREIPKEKFEHFTSMLHFSRKMADAKPLQEKESDITDELIGRKLDLFSYKNQEAQIQLGAQLAERNITPYIQQIKFYLQAKEGDLFFKTILLNVLINQEYDQEIMIEKLDKQLAVNPANLQNNKIQPQQNRLLHILNEQLEHVNPVLLNNLNSLIRRHFFILYPFELEQYKDEVWAAAYHLLAAAYQGISNEAEELAERYDVKKEDIVEAELVLKKIEEISSTIF
ncbi:tetratricopeptide repeat protein [Bacillus sp. Bva_UNVM-123]|uniref:tetratricopeptide repeat protein n=1 Tax=Bacillus sp. Bva_UNVM-123 TaxID=2829798 RepID=UPI00391FAFC3